MYKKIISTLAISVLASLPVFATEQPQQSASSRPNVLVIMVDDMGFADIGSFGSEIPTPNLDKLANQGVKLSNFISASVCSPSRAALLTGANAHQVGLGNLAEEMAPNQADQVGYEGYLNSSALSIAQLLKDNGYNTMMTGKWHLGKTAETSPYAKGFEQTFAMITNASHFADMKPAYSPDPNAKALYRKNGEIVDQLPDNFTYSSQFYVDELISQIEGGNQDKPFFAFLAYSAPHWPLQAPLKTVAKYKGKYDRGYDEIAKQRLHKQKALGLLPPDAQLAQRPVKGQAWNSLSLEEQKVSARGMEVYAAMIEEIDTHTGRLIEHLQSKGRLDNTVLIFMSDNGPEGHDLDETWSKTDFPAIRKVIDESHDFSYENMGGVNSYTFYGPNWAWASSPAFYAHKAFQYEGGVRTAAFVYAPRILQHQGVSKDLITMKDIPATILDIVGVKHPETQYKGKVITPMSGQSALLALKGQSMPTERVHVDETLGKISVRQGHWKLVKSPKPYGNDDWQLFDLNADIAEKIDLANKHPNEVKRLVALWQTYQKNNKVILPNWVSGY